MGTNRRYGSPSERAEASRQRRAMISVDGRRRVRHCWVKTRASDAFDDPGVPGLIVEWARGRNGMWYARVVYLRHQGTVGDEWFPFTRLTPATAV